MKRKNLSKLALISIAFILMFALVFSTAGCEKKQAEEETTTIATSTAYIASTNNAVTIFMFSEPAEEGGVAKLMPASSLIRGTEVIKRDKTIETLNGEIYTPESNDKAQISDSSDSAKNANTSNDGNTNDSANITDSSNSENTESDSGNLSETEEPESSVITYIEIQLPGKEKDSAGNDVIYYVQPANLSDTYEGSVQETEKWVRTPVTVYTNPTGTEISGFAKKGTKLSIIGNDGINEDGSIDKYQVSVPDTETTGWVYSKYLVDDETSALAVNEEIYEIHKDRTYDFELYGGSAANLDWYPYEKTTIEGNEFCTEAKTMYLCADAVVNNSAYLELIANTGINAVVLDIKDGVLAFDADIAADYCPSAYASSYVTKEEYAAAVQAFKDAGVYVIGRIVCFNDSYFAADHPETCIESPSAYTAWPSAYSREAWYYNVQLAVEAVELCGFNEIQFDYVRFPENAYGLSEDPETSFKNSYNEEKAEAIQNFCFYAADCLREAGAYISVDVFGESAEAYVTAYGQYWPAISNIVDAISGMPYTDHYGSAVDTWSEPYAIVHEFALMAAERQTEIETPAVARTWVTGYNTPNWDPYVDYDETKLTEQIQALYDAGLTGGFIPWNGASNISKYWEYSNIWNKTYTTPDNGTEAN